MTERKPLWHKPKPPTGLRGPVETVEQFLARGGKITTLMPVLSDRLPREDLGETLHRWISRGGSGAGASLYGTAGLVVLPLTKNQEAWEKRKGRPAKARSYANV